MYKEMKYTSKTDELYSFMNTMIGVEWHCTNIFYESFVYFGTNPVLFVWELAISLFFWRNGAHFE